MKVLQGIYTECSWHYTQITGRTLASCLIDIPLCVVVKAHEWDPQSNLTFILSWIRLDMNPHHLRNIIVNLKLYHTVILLGKVTRCLVKNTSLITPTSVVNFDCEHARGY